MLEPVDGQDDDDDDDDDTIDSDVAIAIAIHSSDRNLIVASMNSTLGFHACSAQNSRTEQRHSMITSKKKPEAPFSFRLSGCITAAEALE